MITSLNFIVESVTPHVITDGKGITITMIPTTPSDSNDQFFLNRTSKPEAIIPKRDKPVLGDNFESDPAPANNYGQIVLHNVNPEAAPEILVGKTFSVTFNMLNG